jgi:MYXO-CTERM domain-containing protein
MSTHARLMRTIHVTLSLAVATAAAPATGQPTPQGTSYPYYKLKEVNLPEEKRPAVTYTREQLQLKNVGGDLPTRDGEQFQLNLMGTTIESADAAKRWVAQFLQSAKSPLKLDDQIRLNVTQTTAKPDQKFIDAQMKAGHDATAKKLSGKYKTVGKGSTEMLNELDADLQKQAQGTIAVYRFDEYFNGVLIDNTAITVTNRNGANLSAVRGRFYDVVKTSNARKLTPEDAVKKAVAGIKAENKYESVTGDAAHATLVLVPYADGFKYAWKTMITADGPYEVWIDAETGAALQLLARFYYANAKGLTFNPDPNAATQEMSFEVDPASGGKYTLKMTGVIVLSNDGGDGTTGVVQVNDDGSGTANFNQSPINGTTIEHTNQAGYNGQFQQVNIFAHLSSERNYYLLLGSQPFAQMNVTFNTAGGNSFCCPPHYFTGDATTSPGATTCTGPCNSDLKTYNAGIDATVIAHEFGHQLNGNQHAVGGGTDPSNVNEGMADFWALTTFSTDTFAKWWAHDCASATQSGMAPRRAEATDIFGHRNSQPCASDEGHSAGQIIAWANFGARKGMLDLTGWGKLNIDMAMIKAMTTAGIGLTNFGTDKGVHDSYVDLLKQTAPQFSHSRLIHKLLAGYARAGIFLADKDAVLDISDNYLDKSAASGPTFTVWTGRDYTFSGTTVSTASPPFNTQFLVEVANDEAFTSNLVNSGWLGGVASGDGGTATWVLPTANWNTLKGGTDIYYRLTTKDGSGGNVRQSWNPGNGFLSGVPVGRAAINGTGTEDCSCSASAAPATSVMALIPMLPVGLLWVYRRKRRAAGGRS